MNQEAAFIETIWTAHDRGMPMNEDDDNPLGLKHLQEMCDTVLQNEWSSAKVGRWLGWAQAAVVASGVATMEDMKAINKRHSTESYVVDWTVANSMAEVIWNTSRSDEGTISATGANIIASALIADGFGRVSQELPPERHEPNFPFLLDDPEGGHWEHCSPKLIGSGLDCGKTLRRACRCLERGSHDHWIPDVVPANSFKINPGYAVVKGRLYEIPEEAQYYDGELAILPNGQKVWTGETPPPETPKDGDVWRRTSWNPSNQFPGIFSPLPPLPSTAHLHVASAPRPHFAERRESMLKALLWMMNQPQLTQGGNTGMILSNFVRRCARNWGIDLEEEVVKHVQEDAR